MCTLKMNRAWHRHVCRLLLSCCYLLRTSLSAAFVISHPEQHRIQSSSSSVLMATVDRRQAMRAILTVGSSLGLLLPLPSNAGEVGARITEAVTTSDLGISVRTSVVKGAQTMDQLDKQWELFSDRFGLGSERSKQPGRPKKREIPPLKPLDVEVARNILEVCDSVFCDVTGLSSSVVKKEVEMVDNRVRPSFERAGIALSDLFRIETAAQFNYASFVHFKAYGNLLVEKKIDFRSFRRAFEYKCGEQLLKLFQPSTSLMSSGKKEALEHKLSDIKALTLILCQKGLVAASEISEIDPDRLADWADDLSDLPITLALDGDATMNAQILLQEQGLNLIPSYTKFMLQPLLQLEGQQVTIEEYYMDTDYNSDPDLFEVKQVLLNIVLETK